MNRPKLPKQEFKDRERDMGKLLNGMANTIVNILEYLEKDRKATDSVLDAKRESELTVQERQNRRQTVENELEQMRRELNALKDDVQE